ncbi:DEAD/DEAH box helicase family protein [Marinilactibacillus psychrotolerans]|nr:DEAD/DEAH box helicase family protein [Marinilactibacillus psychrotolerans]
MVKFYFDNEENLSFSSPQEMYEDYKDKKINGVLDYQSDILNKYMEKENYSKSDIALELPTGSGKTLVGLLIAEYRRRKENKRVVYVCLNNQLVHQVVTKANSEYKIPAIPFTGSASTYGVKERSDYLDASKIAVTNYSSVFNVNSFFSDADIFIFDDAHSAENYISSNWTLNIKREDHSEVFINLVERLKGFIDNNSYDRLNNENDYDDEFNWYDMVPRINIDKISSDLKSIIDNHLNDRELQYPWSNLRDNIHACNIFLSNNSIVIKPYISPTQTLNTFKNVSQRIFMSATIGLTGELERSVGVSKLKRISLPENKIPSIGRRFFIFPNTNFETKYNLDIFKKIKENIPRALILVESKKQTDSINEELRAYDISTSLYDGRKLEKGIEDFKKESNAIAVLANRYDGVNLQDDVCHFMTMIDLPNASNLQERFFTHKLSTSPLYNERMKTRITQAVGRCTRSTNDYALVVINGMELQNILTSPDKLPLYHPELRAEIETGYQVSKQVESIEELVETSQLIFNRSDEEWGNIEKQIIKRRNVFKRGNENFQDIVNNELAETSKLEVNFQYSLWGKDYEGAINAAIKINQTLVSKELRGFKQYWNYEIGCLYSRLYNNSNKQVYREKANEYFEKAANYSTAISWFRNLKLEDNHSLNAKSDDEHLSLIIDNLENAYSGISNEKRTESFAKESHSILHMLKNSDGEAFEEGFEKLGKLLGYSAGNPKGDAEPDPYWFISDDKILVSECKIYEDNKKAIPVKHVRQAGSHKDWIKDKFQKEQKKIDIYTVFISNSNNIQDSARVYSSNIYYLERKSLVKFAERALAVMESINRDFPTTGNLIWRLDTIERLKKANLVPKLIIQFFTEMKLENL